MKSIFKICLFTVILSGCLGNVNCPSYSNSDLVWMPYEKNQDIKFSNGNDTLSLIIDSCGISDSYSFKKNCDCDCSANAFAYSSIDTAHLFNINAISYSSYGNKSYYYNFYKYKYSNNELKNSNLDQFDFTIEDDQWSADTLATYGNYSHVVKIELDTINTTRDIWQVYIAKSVGIIQFSSIDNRCTWNLIE